MISMKSSRKQELRRPLESLEIIFCLRWVKFKHLLSKRRLINKEKEDLQLLMK